MRRAAALVAVGLLGCGGDRPARITRTDRDAATVAVVDRDRGQTPATATAEREPNDRVDPTAPAAATLNQGVLTGEADLDLYPLELPRDAVLDARLSAMAGLDGALEVRDADGAVALTVDATGIGASERLPNWPLAAGRHYLAVREIPHRPKPKRGVDAGAGRVGDGPPYTLTIALADAPGPTVEREPNDDRGAASGLTLGAAVDGWIGWAGDVDMWKLDVLALAAGDGLDVAVSGVPKVALTVEVTDAAGRRLVRQSGAAGAPISLRSIAPQVRPGEPSAHYVVVSGKPSSGAAGYQVVVTSRVLDADEEAEPNDRPEQANRLGGDDDDDGSMRGELGPGQTDRFVLAAPAAAATLDVIVDGPPGLAATLTVSGGARGAGVRAGDRVAAVGLTVTPGTPIAIALTAPSGKGAAGAYRLRWSLSPVVVEPPADPDPDPDPDPMPPEE